MVYNRRRAIRQKCIDCCAGSKGEVRKCTATECPLWVFRMGKKIENEDEIETEDIEECEEDSDEDLDT